MGRWSRITGPRTRGFAAAAAAGCLAVIGVGVAIQFNLPNPAGATAIDDVTEGVAAFIAAGACAWAARNAASNVRLGWFLLGISSFAWGAGEAVWTVYEVGLGVPVPSPGLPDFGFIAAIPFAFFGIRAFWGEPRGTAASSRAWLDGAIIAISLTFTAWVLGLRLVWQETGDSPITRFIELAYPVGDILVGTMVILALRRTTRRRKTRMFVLLLAIGALALSDSAFSYLDAHGAFTVRGSVLDVGWVLGYLMIALVAVWPREAVNAAADRSQVDLWQLALPWLAVLSAGVSILGLVLTGQTMDTFLMVLIGLGIALLTSTMIFTNRDLLRMLVNAQRSEATLAEIIARAPAGVVRIGPDLRIIDANPRFTDLVRVRADEAKGVLITRYFTGPEALRFADRLEALSAGAADAVEADSEAMRPDGSRFWVHWSATSVPNEQGGSDYYIAMFEDTTARHEAEEAAAANLELMQRLNHVKTEFLQNVSHEFKTALIGIQGFSEFIRDADQLDLSDARAFAADINRDAERLDRMVTEMIALDTVETGRSSLEIAAVDVNELIAHEAAEAERKTRQGAIHLRLDESVVPVAADQAKIAQVVRTLLDNAVKSSPEGGHVTVTTRATGGVEVSVRDEGIGVRSDFDNRLFSEDDPYANNPIRKVVGTGLGIGIARQVIEMHGGRFWVERHARGGTEYHFTVPVLWKDRVAAAELSGAPKQVA